MSQCQRIIWFWWDDISEPGWIVIPAQPPYKMHHMNSNFSFSHFWQLSANNIKEVIVPTAHLACWNIYGLGETPQNAHSHLSMPSSLRQTRRNLPCASASSASCHSCQVKSSYIFTCSSISFLNKQNIFMPSYLKWNKKKSKVKVKKGDHQGPTQGRVGWCQ